MLRLTCFVLSHRLLVVLLWVALALGVGFGILAALIVPFFSMHTGEASATSLAAKGAFRVALDDLGRDGIPAGVLDPIEAANRGRVLRLLLPPACLLYALGWLPRYTCRTAAFDPA